MFIKIHGGLASTYMHFLLFYAARHVPYTEVLKKLLFPGIIFVKTFLDKAENIVS